MPIATINPATGQLVRRFEPLSSHELEARLRLADQAAHRYRRTTLSERAEWLQAAASLLESEADKFGALMALEMGKPIRAGRDEARKCAWACRYYAEQGAEILADRVVGTQASRSWVRVEPLGPVLAVMPWNFPFWQVFRFAAPALMAGNVGLLKHSSNVPQCALEIESILSRAGFPAGAFQTLLIGSDQVGTVISDPRVKAVTLTGSEKAGSDVAARAGREIKKSVLELGGSDPFIVMPSADLNAAVEGAVRSRTINSGQSCIAAKRFIVHDAVFDRFAAGFVERMQALQVGDPLQESTAIGPLATDAIASELEEQVQATVGAGARLLCGGKRIPGPGSFFEPTVLADIPEQSPAAREELFGPVASLFRAKSLDDALRIANASRFGLGSSVWTRDAAEEAQAIAGIEAGQVFVNSMVVSDPRLPFGGIKKSGYGRELSSDGLLEFVNLKTVWVA